jgi:hypothetical protein
MSLKCINSRINHIEPIISHIICGMQHHNITLDFPLLPLLGMCGDLKYQHKHWRTYVGVELSRSLRCKNSQIDHIGPIISQSQHNFISLYCRLYLIFICHLQWESVTARCHHLITLKGANRVYFPKNL